MTDIVGGDWVDKQRADAGWLLCGGSDQVTAVVWVAATGRPRLLAADKTPEGEAMGSFLMVTAQGLAQFTAPFVPAPADPLRSGVSASHAP